jgi:hypothetical protein
LSASGSQIIEHGSLAGLSAASSHRLSSVVAGAIAAGSWLGCSSETSGPASPSATQPLNTNTRNAVLTIAHLPR